MITPGNVKLMLFLMTGGPFLLGALIELITRRALRVPPPCFIRPICRRNEEPFEYWLAIVFHAGMALFLGWLFFFKS